MHEQLRIVVTGTLLLVIVGCSAFIVPCPNKSRPDLVGAWYFVGRPPGVDPKLSDRMLPHPDVLELRPDLSYRATFSGTQSKRLRQTRPNLPEPAVFSGRWEVDWFCFGDLFLPTQRLRLKPGPGPRRFDIQDNKLTLYYHGGGSGCCHEVYERRSELSAPSRVRPLDALGALPDFDTSAVEPVRSTPNPLPADGAARRR